METTKTAQANNIVNPTTLNNYQYLQEPENRVVEFGNSVPPLMGTDPDMGLKEMCEREVYLGTRTWDSATIALQPTPTALDMANYEPLINEPLPLDLLLDPSDFLTNKLANWKYLHADIEFTIKTNNTRYQQGALWMAWEPRAASIPLAVRRNYCHRSGITSFPGVFMNLIDGDTVTMTVPYIQEYEAIDMADLFSTGALGFMTVHVISALRGETTSEQVAVSTYARLKNVKVYVPTPHPIAFQELSTALSAKAEESNTKTTAGIVSLPAKAVAAVADAAGLIPIPQVKAFSSAVGWFSRRVADWATAHGLSKPDTIETTSFYANDPFRGANHVEGLDTTANLGAIQDNEIDPFTVVPNSKDEMSILYVAQRPFVKDVLSWNTGDLTNALIYEKLYDHNGFQAAGLRYASSSEFMNRHFVYWHSSVKYTFKMVGTFAHSGRLMITVTPNDNGPTLNLNDFVTTQAVIWDIQDSTEISITVPWMSNVLWEDGTAAPFKISMLVVNELQNPSTVTDQVHIVMFKSYGDDFQVAIPRRAPSLGFPPVVREASIALSSNLVPLSSEMDFNQESFNKGSITCIGEKIDSLRQAVKQMTPAELPGNSTVGTSTVTLRRTVDMHQNQFIPPSTMASIASMYRFWTGSTRHKFVFDKDLITETVMFNSYYWLSTKHNPFLQYTVPFYSKVRQHVVGNTTFDGININTYLYQTIGTPVTQVDYKYLEGAGDDFNLHYLTGPPVYQG